MTKSKIIGPSELMPQFRGAAADEDFKKMLAGYSLTTAQIYYQLPDAPSLLQEYVWQEYDIAPKFPKLVNFLDFWQRELDGKVQQVKVTSTNLLKPRELKMIGTELTLN